MRILLSVPRIWSLEEKKRKKRKIFGEGIYLFWRRRKAGKEKEEHIFLAEENEKEENIWRRKVFVWWRRRKRKKIYRRRKMLRWTDTRNCEDRARVLDSEFAIQGAATIVNHFFTPSSRKEGELDVNINLTMAYLLLIVFAFSFLLKISKQGGVGCKYQRWLANNWQTLLPAAPLSTEKSWF